MVCRFEDCDEIAPNDERYCDLHRCNNYFGMDGIHCSRERFHDNVDGFDHMTLEGMARLLP